MPGAGTSTSTQDQQRQSAESGNTASTTAGTQTQTQNVNNTVGPWSATQPLLNNIIGSLNGQSTNVTPGQSEALANVQAGANATPNFGAAGAGVAGDLLGSTAKYNGMLSGGLSDYKSSLSPYLSASYLDPMSTPGLGDSLKYLGNNITNGINGQFAAAGRDFSPANSTALSYGLASGLAPILTGQYNQNVATQRGAQDAAYGATGNTATALTGQDQTALGNREAGITAAGAVPGLYTAPGQTQLAAANAAYAQPYGNIGMLQGLVGQLAGLGQTTTGTTTGTGTTAGTTTGNFSGTGSGTSSTQGSATKSPLDQIASGMDSATKMFALLSDEHAKENKHRVGMLYDGSPVWSYNYIGDDTPQIGLLAQEVEKRTPEAVAEMGGYKLVDYGKATERARHIGGMLSDLKLAA
jgi:hypothetical protein